MMFNSLLLLLFIKSVQLKNPNIVFIMADDLRPAIFGYGDSNAITPNLDRLMQRSFYFTRAYAQQALCAPSRNSILTSRRPDTLHLYDFYNYWRSFSGNFTTLPEYFRENGYATYSFGKIFHPGISSNFTDDFPYSWSDKAFHPRSEKFMNSPTCADGSGNLKTNIICPVRLISQPLQTLPDIETIRETKKFLNQHRNSGDAYFLAIGFHKPHLPFKFPKSFLKLHERSKFNWQVPNFKPSDMPNVAWNPFIDIRKRDDAKLLNISFPFGPIPLDFQISIRQSYYSSVSYIDYLLGKLFNLIDFSNTIILFTSDHGWSMGEHSEWAKYSNFEVSTRVPLIIYSPEFQLNSSREISHIVELIDIFPTLVDLAKIPSIPNCNETATMKPKKTCTEGKSLYRLFKGIKNPNEYKTAFSQYPRPGSYPTKQPNSDKPKLKNIQIMGYSIRTKNFRYILWMKFNPKNFQKDWSIIYGEELYDHRIDSNENLNLSTRANFENIKNKLRKKLIRFLSI